MNMIYKIIYKYYTGTIYEYNKFTISKCHV